MRREKRGRGFGLRIADLGFEKAWGMEYGAWGNKAGSRQLEELRGQRSDVGGQKTDDRRQTTDDRIGDCEFRIVDLGCEVRNTLNRLRLSACPEPVEGLTAHSSFERLGRFERI